MKQLILIIGLILSISNASSQIDFLSTFYISHNPGLEAGFQVHNTSDSSINQVQIQLRRLQPTATPAHGGIYPFDPPLEPGSSRLIYPFGYCIDAWNDVETEFEVRVTNVNGISSNISHIFSYQENNDSRCLTGTYSNATYYGVSYLFCEECGLISSISEFTPTEIILKTEYFTITGQNVSFEELQQNVLYIIKETTPTGFNIYKTIPK